MDLIAELQAIVGPDHVLTDESLTGAFTTDWTGRFSGAACAVVRPADVEQVSAVLAACLRARRTVHPQGGNTGLVGGSVPSSADAGTGAGSGGGVRSSGAGGTRAVSGGGVSSSTVAGAGAVSGGSAGAQDRAPVVVSTTRLSTIGQVRAGQVQVGAGATLGDVQRTALAAGLYYGVDIAARDSATIGGTIATNAGGVRVCAFGMTRAQVVGVEAVLADGTVVSHLAGLPKDNTGYDLVGLFTGSEGTLGIITAATLRLQTAPGNSTLALVGVQDLAQAQRLVATCVPTGSRLLAAEVMDEVGVDIVCEFAHLPWPLAQRWPKLVLLEVEGDEIWLPDTLSDVVPDARPDTLQGTDALPDAASAPLPVALPDAPSAPLPGARTDVELDAIVATDATDYARIWRYREHQSEAAQVMAARIDGFVHKLDVSVPLPALPEFAAALTPLLDSIPSVNEYYSFGHIADGNLHVEIAETTATDDSATRAVLELVARLGGSISAEHGIGQAKAAYLSLTRSPQEIAVMRAIKSALDPRGQMAPGVLFADDAR